MKKRWIVPLVAILIAWAMPGTIAAQEKWTPESMIKFKRVGGAAISPDGKWVAYTVSTPITEGEKSEYLTHIWVTSSDGKTNDQYTFGDKSCTDPSFSPDGQFLAFLSSRGGDDKAQIWLLRLTGGEAEKISNAKSGVSSYRWSPTGKYIAYTMTDPETEKEEKDKKEKRDMRVVDSNFKYAHLYRIPVLKDEKGQRFAKRLTAGNFHITNFDWSPDEKTVAFTQQVNPTADAGDTQDISLVPADSGAVKPLVAWKGADSNPKYSPDGAWIAFTSSGGVRTAGGLSDLYVVASSGGDPKKLVQTPDRTSNLVDWTADGKELLVTETNRTSNRVFAVPVSGGAARSVTPGRGSYSAVALTHDTQRMAYIYQQAELPPDVYVSRVAKPEPRKLSDVNSDFGKRTHAKTEVITWKGKDGKEVEGLLTYPANYERGKRYPLIVNIHGGPSGVFTENYTGASNIYPIQAFAQEGYAVLRPNPRGSVGYGADFRFANYDDWGGGDYQDIMSGTDKVIELGVAHQDSLVVCGWSYGGYMTAWVISQTKRFKAASMGAGLPNLVSLSLTTDIPSIIPAYFHGEVWESDLFVKRSGLTYIKGATTPTLILHGERDVRVPTTQGQELYTALKRQHVPAEFVIYPRTPHGPQEPKFILDIGQRLIAWFNRYLGRNGVKATMGSN